MDIKKIIYYFRFLIKRKVGMRFSVFQPLEIHSFIKIQQQSKFIQYENIEGNEEIGIEKRAIKILNDGWTLNSLPLINLDQPIPWESSAKINRSWSFHIHSWDMLGVILNTYSITNDVQFIKPAINIALDWIEKFSEINCASGFAWYDMAVGIRIYRLAFLIDSYIRMENFENSVVEKLLNCLFTHSTFLDSEENISYHNNHGLFQIIGQLITSKRFSSFKEFENIYDKARQSLSKMLRTQFSNDGFHLENSPGYHRMILTTLIKMRNKGLIQSRDDKRLLEKIKRNYFWFIKPNGKITNFGDTDDSSLQDKTILLINEKSKTHNFFEIFSKHKGNFGDADHKGSLMSGYFFVKYSPEEINDDSKHPAYLAQNCAFHSRTHKHADDLSFVWFDNNIEVLIDSGRYGYLNKGSLTKKQKLEGHWYSDPFRIYVESTRAHNTIEIDNINNQRLHPYGSSLLNFGLTKDGLYYSESRIKKDNHSHHYRMLIYQINCWLLVYDELFFEKEYHCFKQWFNFSPEVIVEKINNSFLITSVKNKQKIKIISLIDNPDLSDVYKGTKEPRFQGWYSPAQEEIIPIDSINLNYSNRSTAKFATLFTFYENQAGLLAGNKVNQEKKSFNWINDGVHHKLVIDEKNGEKINIRHNEHEYIE